MKKKQMLLIGAALSGLSLVGCANTTEKTSEPTVMCHGVNSCKGHGQCGGKVNACSGKNGCEAKVSCAGKNSCKGKGLIKMKKSKCLEKGGTVAS